jgi:NADPH:quinone reductase
MGLEIAGEVIAVGPAVSGFAVGDRVIGVVGGDGYAEVARIDYRMAMQVPESLDIVHAGAVPEVFVTTRRASARPISTNAEVTSGPPTRMRVGVFILFHS